LLQQGFVNTSHQFLYAQITLICIALGLFIYMFFLYFLFVYTGGLAYVQCITQYFFDQYINAAKAMNFYSNHRWMALLNSRGLKFAFELLINVAGCRFIDEQFNS
jgi:hypothetical protein